MINKYQEEFYEWVFYQIYPRSFKDSNGDGIGDLNGITEKLDYLKELGINAVWLSPCYKSPNDDNGYDISDYCDIMDEFGTMDDWKKMISEMHKRGIKLIMDLVPNHTSSEHRWFKEARKSKDNPYRDYYYWADEPLNNWKSTFGGSAWEYDEQTEQYYLHSYAVSQPDLNWENPKVREEIIKTIDFWVNLGVDGFRCDVLDQISKTFDDENGNGNGPRLHEYIQMMFDRDETRHLFTVGECWGANAENIRRLVSGDRGELSTAFSFEHLFSGNKFEWKGFDLNEARDMLIKWQELMQENDLLHTLFWENHDMPRSVSIFANDTDKRYESSTMLATMMFLQRGVPFVFQGQEIGTTNNVTDNIDDFNDIEIHNYYNENPHNLSHGERMAKINLVGRDNARRPMAWSEDVKDFGGENTWISPYNRRDEINVTKDMSSDKSIFEFYKSLIAFRKSSNAICHGKYENLTGDGNGFYAYKRTDGKETYIITCNFDKEQNIDICYDGEIVLSNYSREKIDGKFMPYECVVVRAE